MEKGLELLEIERSNHLKAGRDLHNDLKYFVNISDNLISASICYLGHNDPGVNLEEIYPWAEETFKISQNVDSFQARKEDIIKAGSMIVAHLTVMQHLIDTEIELKKDNPNLHNKTIYFKMASNMYSGKFLSSYQTENGRQNIIINIREFYGKELPVDIQSIELRNDEIWTFI